MERGRHCLGLRELLNCSGFEPCEPVHRDGLDSFTSGHLALSKLGLEHGLGATFDHVEEPGCPVALGATFRTQSMLFLGDLAQLRPSLNGDIWLL